MGDFEPTTIRPDFNGSLGIEGRPGRLTSNAGTVLLRELDDRLGVSAALATQLTDSRESSRVKHSLTELLRSWIYTMVIDRTHASAVDELSEDAGLRMASSDRRGLSMLEEGNRLASQPTRSRLLSSLSTESNLEVLEGSVFDSAARAVLSMRAGSKLEHATLDIDSYPHEVHGHQPGSDHNGHYRIRCYHPLGVMLGETGHWLGLKLRPGNVHTAHDAAGLLLPLIERTQEEIAENVSVRGDAGFVGPDLLERLEERRIRYAFRLCKDSRLSEWEEIHARRPPGRPPARPRTWCHDIEHRADTWPERRRVVLVVQERPEELYMHTFFIVTSFTIEEMSADEVLDYYRERGTMEGHIGEHQSVVNGALSSTNRPKSHIKHREVGEHADPIDAERANAAALCLHGIAYNLLNTLRLLGGTSGHVDENSGLHLRRARRILLNVAGRVIISARRATLIVSERTAAIWGRLWKAMRRLEPQPVLP